MRTLAINITVVIFFIIAMNAAANMMCGIAPQLYGDACPATGDGK